MAASDALPRLALRLSQILIPKFPAVYPKGTPDAQGTPDVNGTPDAQGETAPAGQAPPTPCVCRNQGCVAKCPVSHGVWIGANYSKRLVQHVGNLHVRTPEFHPFRDQMNA